MSDVAGMPTLALVLFAPWFLILSVLYWLYPRQPRNARRRGFDALALSPHRATRLADVVRAPRVALLLGAEGPGLPDALLARARAVAIPIVPGFDSLNVATSSGIALAHFFEPDTY